VRANKIGAEQVGYTGVIVQPKFVFLRDFVDTSAASDHLVKKDAGFQVTKKHHGIEPFYIDAGCQQIYCAGDESTFAGAAHRFDQLPPTISSAHAFERIMLFCRAVLLFALLAVKVIHLHRNPVGVDFAGAKNNRFLLGTVVQAKLLEQILAQAAMRSGINSWLSKCRDVYWSLISSCLISLPVLASIGLALSTSSLVKVLSSISGGQCQQHAAGLLLLFAMQNLFKAGADRGILVIAGFRFVIAHGIPSL
jgi:hypothetical protein